MLASSALKEVRVPPIAASRGRKKLEHAVWSPGPEISKHKLNELKHTIYIPRIQVQYFLNNAIASNMKHLTLLGKFCPSWRLML
jgi:hypothetical protein